MVTVRLAKLFRGVFVPLSRVSQRFADTVTVCLSECFVCTALIVHCRSHDVMETVGLSSLRTSPPRPLIAPYRSPRRPKWASRPGKGPASQITHSKSRGYVSFLCL